MDNTYDVSTSRRSSGDSIMNYIYCGNPRRFVFIVLGILVMAGAAVGVTLGVILRNNSREQKQDFAPFTQTIDPYLDAATDPRCAGMPTLDEMQSNKVLNVNPLLSCACLGGMSAMDDDVRFVAENSIIQTLKQNLPEYRQFSTKVDGDYNCADTRDIKLWWLSIFQNVVVDSTGGTPMTTQQMEDLYFLTSFYLETGGLDWDSSDGWMTIPSAGDIVDASQNYCSWFGVFCTDVDGDGIGEITDITLPGNNLNGEITTYIGMLPETIRTIDVNGNRLRGTIPSELFTLYSLETLDFSLNELTGTLSPDVAFLDDNLNVLNLYANRLTGKIPENLGLVTKLRQLHLDQNLFSGDIPGALGNLVQCQEMTMGDNPDIVGIIPVEFGDLPALTGLSIHDTRVGGPIPDEFWQMTTLQKLRLDGNLLEGTIHPNIGKLTDLTDLDLSNNTMVGQLPAEMGQMTLLTALYLHTNAFYGALPAELAQLSLLETVDIGMTNLEGPVPAELCTFTGLQRIAVDCNGINCDCCVVDVEDADCDPELINTLQTRANDYQQSLVDEADNAFDGVVDEGETETEDEGEVEDEQEEPVDESPEPEDEEPVAEEPVDESPEPEDEEPVDEEPVDEEPEPEDEEPEPEDEQEPQDEGEEPFASEPEEEEPVAEEEEVVDASG